MMTLSHNWFSRPVALALAITGAAAGCMSAPGEPIGQATAEIAAANGISVNGISVNGISVNGVSVSGTQLRGVDSTGNSLDGAGWVGAMLTAQMTDGSKLALRIDGTQLLPEPNDDVRTYTITYKTQSGWKPLCTTTTNEAIAFPGTWNLTTVRHQWDANMFSLGCRGATFAKCVELGYNGDNLLDTYHATCIRAIRADYCGDGQSHTITGTTINIYDKLGEQLDTQDWALESNWTPDGATCIHKARVLTSLEEPDVSECIADRADTSCPDHGWANGVLIRTEVNK